MNIASPFDILATTYDTEFTASAIGMLQREKVWYHLLPLLKQEGRSLNILEINCGTGEDALRMAALGHKVTATDASPVMITQAKAKTTVADVNFITCAFENLHFTLAGQKFDLVISNFGGLNCANPSTMIKLCYNLNTLTTANGKLFLVLMSDRCIWEILHYGCRAKFGQAFRRFKKEVKFSVNQSTMPVYYYSPAELKQLFSKYFSQEKKYPVGLFIPPSYLEKKFSTKPKYLSRLNKLEYKWGHSSLSRFADHYCCTFHKSIAS